MAPLKFSNIVTFSSEDSAFPAENLLSADGYKKWKCKEAGSKQEHVILQLEKSCRIVSLDIGNESAAFIEVLVARGNASNEEYQVLLVASSFMTPMDARNEENRARVRIFGSEKLNKSIAEQKWDRVKVVCTQPFSKRLQYGLSFITIHGATDASLSTGKQQTLGSFVLKDEDDEDKLSIGGFFAKRKEKNQTPLTGAAAVRAASSLAAAALASAEEEEGKLAALKRKSTDTTTYSQESHASKPKSKESSPVPAKIKKKDSSRDSSPAAARKPDTSHREKKKERKTDSLPRRDVLPGENDDRPKKASTTSSRPRKTKPFKKLMDDVVFAMSGYVNPERGVIRDMALEMGAKYKSDWGKGCTHLVCAFPNTPKYLQVKEKGKIITKDWIEDCYNKKVRFPWRRYQLGGSKESESEDEIYADDHEKKPEKSKEETKQERNGKKRNDGGSSTSGPTPKKGKTPEPDYGSSTDIEDESDQDTEDEIRRIQQGKDHTDKTQKTTNNADPYEEDTDVDDDAEERLPLKPDTSDLTMPSLPDVFKSRSFFFFGKFKDEEYRQLKRSIAWLNGNITEYMGSEVRYVISKSTWNQEFDEAVEEHPDLLFVKPKWILECLSKKKLIPYQPYLIIPTE